MNAPTRVKHSTAAARLFADQVKKNSDTGDHRPQVEYSSFPDRPAVVFADARPHQLSTPLLRALDLACAKRPICVIQDEAFGVLHQAITVSPQLAGNPIACAAGQRGAEAGVEGGGMAMRPSEHATLFGLWQLVEPFAQTRSRRLRFELVRGLAFSFGFLFSADLPLAAEVCRHVANMGRPADNQQVRGLDQLRRSPPVRRHIRPGRLDVPPERRR